MTHDQIDYCGNCQHYDQCSKLAAEGRLGKCFQNEPSDENTQSFFSLALESAVIIMMLAAIAWLCCACSSYSWQ